MPIGTLKFQSAKTHYEDLNVNIKNAEKSRILGRAYWRGWKKAVSMSKQVVLPGGVRLQLPLAKENSTPAFGLTNFRSGWIGEVIKEVLRHEEGAFVDIGANVGQTLLQFLSVEPDGRTYVGFEPNVDSFQFTYDLIRRNQLDQCNVYPVAMSDSNAFAKMYSLGLDKTDQTASIASERTSGKLLSFIPTLRFDEVIASLEISQIALIKIDVEHAELEVVSGMAETLKGGRPYIVCEVLPTDHEDRLEALMNLLKLADYQVGRLIKSDETWCAVEKVDAFPSAKWTEKNREHHDYIFVPSEKESQFNSWAPGN